MMIAGDLMSFGGPVQRALESIPAGREYCDTFEQTITQLRACRELRIANHADAAIALATALSLFVATEF
jgi:hypothetical protein